MTSRERITKAVAGEPVDRKPMIVWPHDEMYSDAAIVPIGRLATAGSSPRCVLAEVFSPFSCAISKNLDLNSLYKSDPDAAEKEFKSFVQHVEREIDIALNSKADGIFYRLQGAEPKFATPMEYGGHYLEVDRALLQHASTARMNVLCIEGGPEAYIDFVSDLPAQVFAWDLEQTGFSVSALRKMRTGALAAASPEADILFGGGYGLLQQLAKSDAVGGVR